VHFDKFDQVLDAIVGAAPVERVEPEKLLASIIEDKNPHRMAGDELAFDETMIVTIDTRDGREDRAFFSAGYSDYPVGAVTEKDRIFVYGSRARMPRILELRAQRYMATAGITFVSIRNTTAISPQ